MFVAADILKNSILLSLASFSIAFIFSFVSCSSSGIISILFATIICFLVLNFSLYFFSSLFIILKSCTGLRPPSEPDTSRTCNNNLVLSICLKNCKPNPTPSDAPSITPGISANTKLSPYSVLQHLNLVVLL